MQYLCAISQMTEWPQFISKANYSISQSSKSVPQPVKLKKLNWMILWRPTRPSRTNTQKRSPFHHGGLECKSRKSRATWSNRQIGLGVQNEVGQRLTEFCQENALVIVNTLFQHHKRRLSTWTSPDVPESDWLYSLQPKMEKLYTVSKNKTESWLWLRSWTPYCQIQTEIEESRENH